MAANGEIIYNVKFKTDSSQLESSLKKISNMKFSEFRKIKPELDISTALKEFQKLQNEVNQVGSAFQKAMNPQLGATSASKLASELKKLNIKQISKDFNSLGKVGQDALIGLSKEVNSMNTSFANSNKLLDSMAISFKNTIKWGISSSVWKNMTSSLSNAWTYAKKLDSSLNNIRVVSGQSADQMERFAKQANTAARELGIATTDYTNASLIYYQQGITDPEKIKQMTDITVKMSNVLKESETDVSNYMTSIWNNFEDGAHTLEYYADVITKLGSTTASSSQEIAQGLEKFSAIAKTVGLSYEYATSALATVTATTRQSADTVGTAFKTLFARIQDLELGDDGAVEIGKYSEALEKFDIHILDTNGEMKKMDTILNEMGSKWKTLSDAQKTALAQAIAGTRQYSQLVALMDNWDFMTQNLNSVSDATGTLQKQQETYLKSISAHLKTLESSGERLLNSIFDKGIATGLIDGLSSVVNLISNFNESLGGGKNVLLTLGSVATQVFSTQISRGLSDIILNSKKAKAELKGIGTALKANIKPDTATGRAQSELYDSLLEAGKFASPDEQKEIEKIFNNHVEDIQKMENEYNVFEKTVQGALSKVKNFWNELTFYGTYDPEERDKVFKDLESLDFSKGVKEDNDLYVFNGIVDDASSKVENLKGELAALLEQYMLLKQKTDNEFLENKTKEDDEKTKNEFMEHAFDLIDQMDEAESLIKAATGEKIKSVETLIENFYDAIVDPFHVKGSSTGDSKKKKVFEIKDVIGGTGKGGLSLPKIKKEIESFKKTDDYFDQVKAAINSRKQTDLDNEYKYVKNQEELQKRIEQNIQAAKQNLEKYSMAGAINEFVNLASSVGQVASALSTLKNIGNIFSNENLTTTEKIFQLFSAIGTSTAMLINGVTLLRKSFSGAGEVIQGYVKKVIIMGLEEKQAAAETMEAAAANEIERKSEENVEKEKTKSTVVTILKTKADVAEAAATGTLSTANLGAALTFKVLAKEILKVIALSLPWIAAIGAVAGAIYLIVEAAQAEANETKALAEAQEKLKEKTENLKSELDSLEQNFKGYEDAVSIMNQCIKGTEEWRDALNEVNSKVTEIISKYPSLLEFEGAIKRNENGALEIDPNAYNELLSQKKSALSISEKAYLYSQGSSIINSKNRSIENANRHYEYYTRKGEVISDEEAATLERKDSDEEHKLGGNADEYNADYHYGTIKLEESDIQKLKNLTPEEFRNAIEGMANTYVEKFPGLTTDKFIEAFKDQQSTINHTNQLIDEANIKLENIHEALIPDDVIEAGDYAKDLYRSEEKRNNANIVDLANKIRTAEKEGVDKTSEEGDVDAITFMRMWVESQGMTWDPSKFENVDGKDYDRTYWYDGKQLDANEMADEIASSVVNGSYEITNPDELIAGHGKERWNDIVDEIRRIPKTGNIITQAQNNKSQLAAGLDISEELADKLLSKELNKLTTEDLDKLNSIGPDKIKEEMLKITDLEEVSKLLGKLSVDGFVEGLTSKDTIEKAAQNTADKIKKIYKDGAKELETSEEELKSIGNKIKEINQGLSDTEVAKLAVDTKKYAKSLEGVGNVLKSNTDLLKDWKDGKKDILKDDGVSEAVGALRKEINDSFGVDLSEDQLKKSYDIIEKAINGDIKALQKFQEMIAVEKFNSLDFKVDISEKTKEDISNKLGNFIDEYNEKEIGFSIDANTDPFLQSMNDLIEAAGMTEGEVNKYFENIGYTPDVEVHDVEVKSVNKETGTWTDAEGKSHPITSEIEVGSIVQIPVIKGAKKVAPPKFTYKKDKGNGGGGGSKKTAGNKIDAEKDLYEKVNVQLGKTAKALSKIQGQTERLTGLDLVKNLVNQTKLLNKEIGYTNDKLKIMYGEQSDLQNKLSSTYGAKFDSEGVLTNYSDIFDKELARANKVLTNKKSTDKQREAAQKRWDNFQKWYQRYDTLVSSEIPDQLQKIQDDLYKQIDNKVKALNLELEVRVDIKDFEETFNEFYEKVLNPNGYKKGSAIAVLEQTVRDFDALFNSGVLGAGSTKLDEILYNPDVFTSSDAESGQSVTDDAGRLEQLRSVLTDLMSNTGDLEDFITRVGEGYRDVMSEVSSEMENQLQIFEQMATAIDQEMNRIKLMEGDFLASTDLKNFFAKKEASLRNRVAVEEQQLTVLAADYERTQTELADAVAAWEASKTDENPNGNLELQYIMEEAQKTADAAWDAYFDKMSQLATDYESLVNVVKESAINAVNSVYAELYKKASDYSYDYLNQEWELLNSNADMYLDSINRAYGIQKIANKFNEAIDTYQGNISAQKKLNELKEKELESLRNAEYLSEHDVELAEKKYEIAVKQMELEEAKQNKSNLRLRRDSQGNYTYQYGADQDNIAKLQNELEDLYNSLYNFQNDFDRQLNEQALRFWEERRQLEAEAMSIIDEEERQKRLELIEEQTNAKLAILYAQRARARTELEKIALSDTIFYYSQNEDAYKDMTEEQRIALDAVLKDGENGINRAFENLYAHYDEATGEKATDALKSFSTRVSSISDDFITNMFTMRDNGQIVSEQITKSIMDISDGMSTALYGDGENDKGILGGWEDLGSVMIEKADEIEESQTKMTDALIAGWKDATTAASGYFDTLVQMFNDPKVQEIIAELKDSIIKGSNTYLDDQKDIADDYITSLENIIDTEKGTGGDGAGNGGGQDPNQGDGGGNQSSGETWPYGKASATSGLLQVGSRGTGVKAVQYALNKLGFGNSGTSGVDGVFGSNTATAVKNFQKWVKLSADGIVGNDTRKKFAAKGYDTGGYTGSWGPEGKLAFLHQKELVLNAKDTENILAAVGALRLMNQAMLSQLSAGNIPVGGNGLEQNVHIEANFPNATNHNEIEEALRNLVNAASQRTTK